MISWEPNHLILDEYLIERMLGEGGMGRVWLVKSQSTGRHFAVKQALVQAENHRKAFLAELQTWIDLPEHPNIVPCRFFRTVGDEVVIFADYIEGGSLADWIARGKLTRLEQILDVAIQFAWGLHAIHERGLIHQDVKPGNVLMTPEGVPMVTDFGLARARLRAADGTFVSPVLPAGQQSVLVSSGGMTPAYASPEQRNGKSLSRKTDIWSWGVSVLDIIMGEVSCPYGGHVAADVLECLHDYGRERGESLKMPEVVVSVLNKCFARDPSERWPDMSVIAEALVAAVWSCTGYFYFRTPPPIHGQVGGMPLIRRDYTGGGWRDPQKWLSIAYAMQDENISRVPSALSEVNKSRSGSAVSDLADYHEALGMLIRLAQGGNIRAIRYACDLCFEMAHIHNFLNDFNGMITAYDLCVHYAELLREESCAAEYAVFMMANALDQKALGYRMCGEIATAVRFYNQSVGYWRILLASHPEDSSIETEYAVTLRNYAIALRNKGEHEDANNLYDEAIRIFQHLESRQNDIETRYSMELQRTWRFKGVAFRIAGHIHEAQQCYNRAMTIMDSIGSVRNDSSYLIDMARLCEVRARILPHPEAILLFEQAIKIYEKLIRDSADNNLVVDLAGAYNSCCIAQANLGNYERALARCLQSVSTWEQVVHLMGKQQYVKQYYEARLTRLGVYILNKKDVEYRSESRILCDELYNLGVSNGNNHLASLYAAGQSNGYW